MIAIRAPLAAKEKLITLKVGGKGENINKIEKGCACADHNESYQIWASHA